MKYLSMFRFSIIAIAITILIASSLSAQEWIPVTDDATLKRLFSDTEHTATLGRDTKASAKYNADGTGTLKAWGETFDRQWKVEKGAVGLLIDRTWQFYTVERNSADDTQFRATRRDTGEKVVFQVEGATVAARKVSSTDSGGAVKPSADEVAKSLANPNTPLATMTTRIQLRWFEGDLPDADDQSSTTILFQPSFPFSTERGNVVYFRPAFPIIVDQPVFNPDGGVFNGESGLGDISFDLGYGVTNKKTGLLTAGGIVSTLPLATSSDLGAGNLTLGPELLVGLLRTTWLIGAFPNHQWTIGGWGDRETNLTTIQLFGLILPGKAWSIGTTPIMTYDWMSEQWTVPLQLSLNKTVIWGGRPWKLGLGVNYYVEKPDAFGPEWMFELVFAPVVENVLARWF